MGETKPHILHLSFSTEDLARMNAQSDTFREMGQKSGLPDNLLAVELSQDGDRGSDGRFVTDFNNAVRGLMEYLAKAHGIPAQTLALKAKLLLSQPEPTRQ